MKKTISRAATIFLTVALLLAMLSFLSSLTIRKKEISRFADFFEHSESYDLLFFGTSHVFNGISPFELWESHGISAYNCGSAGAAIPTTYWAVVNALDYSQPELLVLDCYRIGYPGKYYYEAGIHRLLDAFPLSFNKLRAAIDLGWEAGLSSEIVFPFVLYHSRWNELGKDDFLISSPKTNGFAANVNISPGTEPSRTKSKAEFSDDMPGVAYLRKIIELCRERDIDVLLTYLPFPASAEDVMEANAVADLAAEYDLDYINFLDLSVIDYELDVFDSVSHLNMSGARKVSAYLGDYISSRYSLPDRRSDPAYTWMAQADVSYRDYELSLLDAENTLFNFLMLLHNNDYAVSISISPSSPLYDDELILKLIENIPVSGAPKLLPKAADTGQAYLLYIDNVSGEIQEYIGGEIPVRLDTSLGNFEIQSSEYIGISVFDGLTGENLGCDRSFVLGTDGIFVRSY